MASIPYDKLNIPDNLRKNVEPDSPKPMRLATAKGVLPIAPDHLLGMLTVLAADAEADVREAALASLKTLPNVVSLLGQRTHAKVLEVLAQVRTERALDERIITLRSTNDRTAMMIAARADARLCELIAANHERLLITPDLLLALHKNPQCSEADFERANAFLRMEHCAPELPEEEAAAAPAQKPVANATTPAPVPNLTPAPVRPVAPPPEPTFDLDAEIEAALAGKESPMLVARRQLEMFDIDKLANIDTPLEGFSFDFKSDEDFSIEMVDDGEGDTDNEVKLTIAKQIAGMSPGKKIKLAYVGNKEVRGILIRDKNKQVALAVVKSGRMSDAEAISFAGNRNMISEVLREISANGEWMRKYPLKVALVNNPRCPPSIAVPIVNQLQSKDLGALSRNKNVSSVIFTMALKLLKSRNPA